jgi:hypothetical protein
MLTPADVMSISRKLMPSWRHALSEAATVDGQLDYFGATEHEVLVRMRAAVPGELVMTEPAEAARP